MATKSIVKLLIAVNVILIGISLMLFNINNPSELVQLARTFMLNMNAGLLVLNFLVLRHEY